MAATERGMGACSSANPIYHTACAGISSFSLLGQWFKSGPGQEGPEIFTVRQLLSLLCESSLQVSVSNLVDECLSHHWF